MGLFSFVASAGAKLFGGKSIHDIANLEDVMVDHLKKEGLDPKHIYFWAENDALVAAGYAPSKEFKEKVIVASGNVEGIDKVEDRIVVGNPPAPPPKPAPVAAAPVVAEAAKAPVLAERPPMPTKEQAEKDAWESKTHVVEKGDTLSKIAKEVYGDAMKYPVIFEANKPMLKHPDKIYPGQVLRIPKL